MTGIGVSKGSIHRQISALDFKIFIKYRIEINQKQPA